MVVATAKKRILVVGGKPFNLPRQLADHFYIVKQIEQDQKRFQIPQNIEFVLVLTNWVNHTAIQTVQRQTNVPIIWVRKGWNAMKAELQRRGLVPPDPEEVPEPLEETEPVEVEPETPATSGDDTSSMSEEELERLTRPENEKDITDEIREKWKENVHRFAAKVATDFNLSVDKIIDVTYTRLNGDLHPDLFVKELGLDEEKARTFWVRFSKSRGQFRGRVGLPHIHSNVNLPPRKRKPSAPVRTAGVSAIPSDVDRMLEEFLRLTGDRSKLLEKQHEIELEIKKLDEKLQMFKPFESHLKGLAEAARKLKATLERGETA